MKKLFLFIFIILITSAQAIATDSIFLLKNLIETEQNLDAITIKLQDPLRDIDSNLVTFNELLSILNHFKEYDIKFTSSIISKIKNRGTLSGDELYLLRRLITTYYKLNKKILDYSEAYDFCDSDFAESVASIDNNRSLFKASLIWLSGNLLVIDHLETIHTLLYETDGKLRRIVKNALLDRDSDIDGSSKTIRDLIKIDKESLEIASSKKFSQHIIFIRAAYEEINKIMTNNKHALQLLNEIVNNKTAIKLSQGDEKFNFKRFGFVDAFFGVIDKTVGWISKKLGNIAGSIAIRTGHLWRNQDALISGQQTLRPMDIIFEKSPFILTDTLIPGYFNHVALYLGTKEQLEAQGMWNHPDIVPYQHEIETGKVILEAVRKGVRLTSLEEFLNTDEIMIIRKDDALTNPSILSEQISRGMKQIGKAYDFNFDISTLDKIVCSELLYIVFGNVLWPTQYQLGRPTISPDNIAEILFFKQTKFKMQSYILAKRSREVKVKNKIDFVAKKLNYELRSSDGGPLQNHNDPANSFWKSATNCHLEQDNNYSNENEQTRRVCNTTYKKFSYEEQIL